MRDNSSKTGIISIEDLPEDFIIDIDKSFKKRLLMAIGKYFATWLEMSQNLDLNFRLFNGNKHRYKPKQIIFFKRICKFLESKGHKQFNLKELEKNIIFMKSHFGNKGIKNPKLPFNFNTHAGGCFIGAVLHDGSIKSSLIVSYCNKKRELRDKFVRISKDCFGDIEDCKEKYTIVLPKIIGELLTRCFGMKSGKKTVNDAHVPEFSFKAPKNFTSGYLNFAISDDGSVGINLKHNIYRIRIGLHKDVTNLSENLRKSIKKDYRKFLDYAPNIIKADKLILERLGIKVNGPFCKQEYNYVDKNNKKRASFYWELSITNLIDIEKFYENVKLTHKEKQKRLDKIMKIASKTHRQTKKGNVFKEALLHCNKLISDNKVITALELSKSLNRSLGRTQWIIKRMVKNNLIEKIGETPQNKEYLYKLR